MASTPEELQADLALAQAAAGGCDVAITKLVTTYERRIFNASYAVPSLGYEKEDMLQLFWESIFRTRLPYYQGVVPLGYWLRRELASKCHDVLRKTKSCYRIPANNIVSMPSDVDSDERELDYRAALDIDTPDGLLEAEEIYNYLKTNEIIDANDRAKRGAVWSPP